MRVFDGEPWKGPAKLIIGIDIGTTQSAVSFAHMYPEGPQSLHRITHWPGQEGQEVGSKIPTLVYYNTDGEAVSFGAEAASPEIIEQAEDEGWRLARHFKLYLHPETMRPDPNFTVEPLPDGVPLQRIYTDFMVYLMRHTRRFFETRIVDGVEIWAEIHEDMEVVIAHPNGWTIKEQKFLREAAIGAGYTTKAKSHTHIHFVSEAEASTHFCMFHSDLHARLNTNANLIVCDAGGSTIDITAYQVQSMSPVLRLAEKKSSACVQAGAIFVDQECRNHLALTLRKLNLPEEEYKECLDDAVTDFEGSAKRKFQTPVSDQRIKLGTKITQPNLGIRRGNVTLPGRTIKTFFDRSVRETTTAIRQQMAGFSPEHLLLVGGFGESPYLRQVIMSEFESSGCRVTIANDGSAKAVADGAVMWWAKLSVTSRATRMPYGIENDNLYDPDEPSHTGRHHLKGVDGRFWVRGMWSQIVNKDVVMDVNQKAHQTYCKTWKPEGEVLGNFKAPIYAWTVDNASPNYWLMNSEGQLNTGFKKMCTVKCSLDETVASMKKYTGPDGVYCKLDFDVVLMFGGTELKAYIEWKQDGETLVSQAVIVPDAI